MMRKIGITLVAVLLAGSPAWGQDWAKKMFQTDEHDFGTVARGAKAEFDFVFSNIYLEDVHIGSVRSSCGCTSVQVVNPDLKTYEQGSIHATFNTGTFLGQRGATLTVMLDKPFPAEVQLHVKGYIRSDVVFDPGSVQLGEVEKGYGVECKIAVNYAGWDGWQILGVRSSNPHITASVAEVSREGGQVSYTLAVRLNRGAPVGEIRDHLMLVTNEAQGTQMPLAIEGRVVSGVSVSPASLFMGVVKPGEEVTKWLVVKGSRPFHIVSVTCDDKSFSFGTETDQTAKTIHVVPVKFVAGQDAGKVSKTIRITTDVGQSVPQLEAYAVVSSNEK
jgi:hypothetical protein